MHEESQISPKVVVLVLVLVEVQTQMLKLVAALAANEAYERFLWLEHRPAIRKSGFGTSTNFRRTDARKCPLRVPVGGGDGSA